MHTRAEGGMPCVPRQSVWYNDFAWPNEASCPTIHANAGPGAILRVLDPRPPTSQRWALLPHVRVATTSSSGASPPTASMQTALRCTRHAGWVTSAALFAAAAAAHASWAPGAGPVVAAALHAATCMAGLVLACSLPTDLLGQSTPGSSAAAAAGAPSLFFCGNLGLLLASVTGGAWLPDMGVGLAPFQVAWRCSVACESHNCPRHHLPMFPQPRLPTSPCPPHLCPTSPCLSCPSCLQLPPRRVWMRMKLWSGRQPSA